MQQENENGKQIPIEVIKPKITDETERLEKIEFLMVQRHNNHYIHQVVTIPVKN